MMLFSHHIILNNIYINSRDIYIFTKHIIDIHFARKKIDYAQ